MAQRGKKAEELPRIKTQQGLASIYCVEQSTISDWVKNEENPFPKKTREGWNLAEVGQWYNDNCRRSKEFEVARARKMAADAEKQELAVAEKKREVVPLGSVEQQWAQYIAEENQEVKKGFRVIAPKLAGGTASDILKKLEKWWEDLQSRLADNA